MTDIQLKIIDQIATSVNLLGGHYQLEAAIRSWGDTLDEEDVLALVTEWNEEAKTRK